MEAEPNTRNQWTLGIKWLPGPALHTTILSMVSPPDGTNTHCRLQLLDGNALASLSDPICQNSYASSVSRNPGSVMLGTGGAITTFISILESLAHFTTNEEDREFKVARQLSLMPRSSRLNTSKLPARYNSDLRNHYAYKSLSLGQNS